MLRIADQLLDPQLIVLDKDGTLIAFDALWHAWFRRFVEAMDAEIGLHPETLDGLAGTLGYNRHTDVWDPFGPLTLASVQEVALLAAGQLYRYEGLRWDEALAIVEQAQSAAWAGLPLDELIQPIGDVRSMLARLAEHGILLALATTDNRAQTEHTLRRLDLLGLFATTVCGDDGIPVKPAPDMAEEICRRVGISPGRAIMVGDTVADLLMARRAGYQCAVAVTSGAMPAELLAPYADLVIPDIHAIEIVPNSGENSR